MPCTSDYMEPTRAERHRRRAAQCLVELRRLMRVPPLEEEERAARDAYGGRLGDHFVARLCGELQGIVKTVRDELLYSDARDKGRRMLAEWWEEHEEVDRDRERRERVMARKEEALARGISKLTPEEAAALGWGVWDWDKEVE